MSWLFSLSLAPFALKWGGALLLTASLACIVWGIAANPSSLPRRLWSSYVTYLERKLHNMFIQTSGTRILVAQLCAAVGLLAGKFLTRLPSWYWLVGFLVVALGPALGIERMRRVRLKKLETQVEPFLVALANGLKTTPSIGSALAGIEPLLNAPMRDEIGLVLKEVRVGSTLEQSLLNMSSRVRVMELDAALSSILIGRQVGGNLPEILDGTAATLREMTRLAGMVRSKTASGRTQLVVLALAPVVVLLGFDAVSPGYFNPLSASFVGWVVSFIAGVFWVSAVVVARRVLAVEL